MAKETAQPGEAVLEVADLVVLDEREHPAVNGVSFRVRAGEIVGIAGVQGNGQTELVRALTGMRAPLSGSIKVDGEEVAGSSPRRMHKLGVAHVPEDRLRHGLVTSFTVAENMVLDSYHSRPYSRGMVMDWDKTREEARRLVEQFDVRTPSIEVKAANLSGGNQQKMIVAREFGRPDVEAGHRFPADAGPGRGVHRVHPRPDRGPTRPGAAILIVSTELDEVMALSDRLLVMYRGKVVAELDPQQVTPADVGLYMAGATAVSDRPEGQGTPEPAATPPEKKAGLPGQPPVPGDRPGWASTGATRCWCRCWRCSPRSSSGRSSSPSPTSTRCATGAATRARPPATPSAPSGTPTWLCSRAPSWASRPGRRPWWRRPR